MKSDSKSITYGFRTKSAQSGGLEKIGPRDEILGLRRSVAVRRFAREGPCLLGICPPWRADREYFVRRNWRRETNRDPTLSGLWITRRAAAQLNDIDPHAWLADVLARLPDHPVRRIHEFLPWNWKARAHAAAA